MTKGLDAARTVVVDFPHELISLMRIFARESKSDRPDALVGGQTSLQCARSVQSVSQRSSYTRQ
jgi:hypothetical protein